VGRVALPFIPVSAAGRFHGPGTGIASGVSTAGLRITPRWLWPGARRTWDVFLLVSGGAVGGKIAGVCGV